MPWIAGTHGAPGFYRPPAHGLVAFDDADLDLADARRRAALRWRDEVLGVQKARAKAGDRTGARFFGGMAAEAMKEYRGWCHALSLIACHPPGDCRDVQANPDLAPWIDRAFDALDLARGGGGRRAGHDRQPAASAAVPAAAHDAGRGAAA